MQQSKGGCLVFCKSRKGCESGATEMSKMIHQATISEDDRAARMSVAMNLLADQSARAHQPLEALLLAATGVAYHHAELSACERRTVEKAFRSGVIHTLFCTTTLAAGRTGLSAVSILMADFTAWYVGRSCSWALFFGHSSYGMQASIYRLACASSGATTIARH